MRKISVDELIEQYHIDTDDLYETFLHNSAAATVKKFRLKTQKQVINILTEKGYDLTPHYQQRRILEHWISDNNINLDDLYECFLHNGTQYVSRTFNIPPDSISKILIANNYDIAQRDPIELRKNKNGYNIEELVGEKHIDIEDLYNTYMNNGGKFTAEKFGLSNFNLVLKILNYYHYDISARDVKKINYEKTAATIKERYGVEHALQNPASKEKLIRTNQEKFGSNFYMGTDEFKTKSIETNLKKYGYEWSTQSPEVKQHHDEANYLKYGVKDSKQAKASDKLKPYLNDLNASCALLTDNAFTFHDLRNYFSEDSESQLNVWLYRFDLYKLLKHSSRSYPESQLADYLEPFGFTIRNDRKVLGNGQEIDIYNPTLKIGVEFNGIYYHSTACISDKNYHLNKSKLAEANGIRLIHVYENEWIDPAKREKIKSLLTIASNHVITRIYARDCDVHQITNAEARKFNDKNHLQGHRNAQVTYGLFYQNNLVQLMSFSRTKYNRNLKDADSWEIIRGCPGSNNIVIGGVSKLFKHFVADYNPKSVFSYCDFNKFDGKGYLAIGMKFVGYTGPDKKWVIGYDVVNRNPHKYHELKNKATAIIWGAGSKKYIWENPNYNQG